uniref:Chemosensory protein n=1 Tax=Conogethes punctiferalis TaxID=1133088 RepID=A0A2H4FY02_CONPF|nr:chemosensory protein [Conogethes punctiferalis]
MKLLLSFLIVTVASMVVAAPAKNADGIDVEELIANRRLLLPYIKCALDQGKCSSSAKKVKEHIREALELDCAKCNESEKKDNMLIFKHMINKENDYWKQLITKYDPKREYAPKYEKLYLGKE